MCALVSWTRLPIWRLTAIPPPAIPPPDRPYLRGLNVTRRLARLQAPSLPGCMDQVTVEDLSQMELAAEQGTEVAIANLADLMR